MKIAIGASPVCFAKGGTERVAIGMAHAMLERGHEVHLFAFDHGKDPVFPLNPKVQLQLMSSEFGAGSHAEISKARQYLKDKNIDVFISLQSEWTHMLWALCCLGTGTPFICSERSDPRFSETVTWNKPGRMSVLACADAIHELVPTHSETVPEMHRSKIRVLPNAAPKTDKKADVSKKDGIILFLARFIPGKRADLLLRSFAILAPDYKNWKLRLAGYGPEEENLRKLAAELRLREQAEFVINPASWEEECSRAQIYCLPTKVEGFPNTLLEAMACGLPIAGLADCPAMAGIVRDEGLLAREATPESLAGVLKTLMDSPQLRQKMGAASIAACATRYESERLWQEWEQFLLEVSKQKGSTIMDSFIEESRASQFTLASAVRREYLYRNFGEPMPWSWPWWKKKSGNFFRNVLLLPEKGWGPQPLRNWLAMGASLRDALSFAKNPRDIPYFFRQLKKTRKAGPKRSPNRSAMFAQWVNSLASLKGKSILAVGCGDIRELAYLRNMGAEVIGIDLYGQPGIESMNMEELKFANNSFDGLYACHSFEHCMDQAKAAKEFMRVVKPGGFIAIEVPTNPVPGKVDLHSCASRGELSGIFQALEAIDISEMFLSKYDPLNGAEEDICRMLARKK